MVRLLLPILIGLVALVSIEFSDVMAWLLVQPTSIVLAGLACLAEWFLCSQKAWPTRPIASQS